MAQTSPEPEADERLNWTGLPSGAVVRASAALAAVAVLAVVGGFILGEYEFDAGLSLPAGLGSNDIGLDRGKLGPSYVVRFERAGPRVLLVAPNLDYRSSSSNPAEVATVRDAFAEGILYGFPIVGETNGRLLVEATPFVLRDAARAAILPAGVSTPTSRLLQTTRLAGVDSDSGTCSPSVAISVPNP